MRATIIILLGLCLVANAQDFGLTQPFLAAPPTGAAPCVDLVSQGFEGTGYDNGETWVQSGSDTINKDYTAHVLDGSQSLFIASTNGAQTTITFAGQNEVYVYMMIRPEVINGP